MWTVVYVASSLAIAQAVCDRLQTEGFLVRSKAIGRGKSRAEYQILVPKGELSDVQELLSIVLRDVHVRTIQNVQEGNDGSD